MKRTFIIFDSRALTDVDHALVMSVAKTRAKAISEARSYGPCVVLSYEERDGKLVDEKREWADPGLSAEGWPTE